MSTSLIPSTELRNFISDPLRLLNKKNDNVKGNDGDDNENPVEIGFAGSEDELSLCASDVENDVPPEMPIIQCSIISSCCNQDQNTDETRPADQNISQETESKVLPSDESIDHATDDITAHEALSTEPENNLDLNHSGEDLKPKLEITLNDNVVDDEQPGPSGYKKPSESDSDSNDSVIEIGPPTLKHPRVLNLITDSDEDTITSNTQQGSGKQKLRKIKKLTVKDKLAKQEGVLDEREDLQDLNCSVCLGPFEDRTFLKQCFHILFNKRIQIVFLFDKYYKNVLSIKQKEIYHLGGSKCKQSFNIKIDL